MRLAKIHQMSNRGAVPKTSQNRSWNRIEMSLATVFEYKTVELNRICHLHCIEINRGRGEEGREGTGDGCPVFRRLGRFKSPKVVRAPFLSAAPAMFDLPVDPQRLHRTLHHSKAAAKHHLMSFCLRQIRDAISTQCCHQCYS